MKSFVEFITEKVKKAKGAKPKKEVDSHKLHLQALTLRDKRLKNVASQAKAAIQLNRLQTQRAKHLHQAKQLRSKKS